MLGVRSWRLAIRGHCTTQTVDRRATEFWVKLCHVQNMSLWWNRILNNSNMQTTKKVSVEQGNQKRLSVCKVIQLPRSLLKLVPIQPSIKSNTKVFFFSGRTLLPKEEYWLRVKPFYELWAIFVTLITLFDLPYLQIWGTLHFISFEEEDNSSYKNIRNLNDKRVLSF